MSYLDYINRFWQLDDLSGFSPTQTRLYFYLLSLFNRTHWRAEWLECSDKKCAAGVGISVNTMKLARTKLKTQGLIDFEVGGKGHAHKTRYRLRCQNSIPTLTPTPFNSKIKSKNYESKNRKSQGFITGSGDFDK